MNGSGESVRFTTTALASTTEEPGYTVMPTAARILWKGSASPIQQVFDPSAFS